MPVICAIQAITSAIHVVKDAFFCVLNLAILDFHQSGEHFKNAFIGFFRGIFFAASALIDALWESFSLLTRTITTPIAAVVNAVKGKQGEESLNDGQDDFGNGHYQYPYQQDYQPSYGDNTLNNSPSTPIMQGIEDCSILA